MQKNRETFLLWVLAGANFTHAVDFMIMMPLGPQLMKVFGVSPQQHAALVSAYSFAAGIAGFFFSFYVDRFDRKKTMIFSYMVFMLGTIACGFAPNYEMLLIARAVAGSFGGLLGALILAVIGDTVPYERRGAAMGVLTASFSASSVFGVPFSLLLTSRFGWHAPFFFVAAVSAIILFGLFMFPPMKFHGAPKRGPKQVLVELFQSQNEQIALAFSFVLLFGQFLVIPFVSPYMVANVGFTNDDLPWLYFMGGLATIFTSPQVGKLADRYGKHRIFTVFSFLTPIPVLLTTHMGAIPIWQALIVTTFFFIISNGRFVPSNTMISGVVPMERRGSFLSLNSCVVQLGLGLGSYLAGTIVIQDSAGRLQNYNIAGYLSVVLCFAALYLARKIKSGN